MPLGSSSPGTAGAAVTPWGWHQPWQLVGNATVVREGGSGWERPGDAPGCRRCSWLQENFPAAGESLSCRKIPRLQENPPAAGEFPSCRRISQLQENFPAAGDAPSCRRIPQLQNFPPEQPRPPGQSCPAALWALSVCSGKPLRQFTSIFMGCSSPLQSSLLFWNSFFQPFQDPTRSKAPAANRS